MDSRSFCRCLLCTMHAFLLGTELKLADSEQKVSEEQWIGAHGAGGDSVLCSHFIEELVKQKV